MKMVLAIIFCLRGQGRKIELNWRGNSREMFFIRSIEFGVQPFQLKVSVRQFSSRSNRRWCSVRNHMGVQKHICSASTPPTCTQNTKYSP